MRAFRTLTVAVCALTIFACTRKADSPGKLKLSIGNAHINKVVQRGGNNALCGNTPPPPPLHDLIVNVQVPNQGPIFKHIQFDDGVIAPAVINVDAIDVPTTTGLLVQVLAVYQASGGSMELRYDQQPVSGTDVYLTPAPIGAATKQS